MDFQKGDVVVLNPEFELNKKSIAMRLLIEKGVEFTVLGPYVEDDKEYVRVEYKNLEGIEKRVTWYAARFIPLVREIAEGVYVKCIDQRRSSVLVKGSVYKVEKIEEKEGKKLLRVSTPVRIVRHSFPIEMFEWNSTVAPKEWEGLQADWQEDFLNRLAAKEHGSLCSFAIMTEDGKEYMFTNAPCHAALSYGSEGKPVKAIALCFSRHYQTMNDKHREGYKRFLNYLVNESPMKDCFIPRKPEHMVMNGVLMNIEKTTNEIAVAAVASRHYTEFTQKGLLFDEVMELGFDGNVALFVSTYFTKQMEGYVFNNWQGGHHFLDSYRDAEGLFNFFKKGFNPERVKNQRPAKEKLVGYRILDTVAPMGEKTIARYINSMKQGKEMAGQFGAKVRMFDGQNALIRMCAAFSKVV